MSEVDSSTVSTLRPLARLMARSGLNTRRTRRIFTTFIASLLQSTNAEHTRDHCTLRSAQLWTDKNNYLWRKRQLVVAAALCLSSS